MEQLIGVHVRHGKYLGVQLKVGKCELLAKILWNHHRAMWNMHDQRDTHASGRRQYLKVIDTDARPFTQAIQLPFIPLRNHYL